MSLNYFLPLFFLVLSVFFGSTARAEELSVHFKTTPRLELLRPFADPIDLSLLVTSADGKPVKQGTVALRLDAPAPGRFFSTDYPLVEGTVLNEMRLPLFQGKADLKYLFPIRGEYRLAVDIVANDGKKTSKIFNIRVRENRAKWLALGAFSVGLFALGFIAGRIFTGAGSPTVALIVAGVLAGSAGTAGAQQSQAAILEVEPATVGKPSLVRWSQESARGRQVALSLSITHLEKEKVVFAIDKIPVAGEWSMSFHFPDGAEYRIVAVAEAPGVPPARAEQTVAVTGVEPPAKAMVPAISYFLVVIALGLGAGRWSKRRAAAR